MFLLLVFLYLFAVTPEYVYTNAIYGHESSYFHLLEHKHVAQELIFERIELEEFIAVITSWGMVAPSINRLTVGCKSQRLAERSS